MKGDVDLLIAESSVSTKLVENNMKKLKKVFIKLHRSESTTNIPCLFMLLINCLISIAIWHPFLFFCIVSVKCRIRSRMYMYNVVGRHRWTKIETQNICNLLNVIKWLTKPKFTDFLLESVPHLLYIESFCRSNCL